MTPSLEAHALARRVRRPGPDRARCERRLVELYQTQPARKEDVVVAFTPFASSFAARLKRGEEPLDDLRQVALVGLVKALDRFDPSVGRSFTAYAAPTISGELRRHYRDTGWAVHVPRSKQELAQRMATATRALEGAGEPVDDDALAGRLGVSTHTIAEGRVAQQGLRATSLQRPLDGDDDAGTTLGDVKGADDPGFDAVEDRATLAALTRRLPARDREIVRLRYVGELTQREIGARVGISQMQVSRILRQTLATLSERAAVG